MRCRFWEVRDDQRQAASAAFGEGRISAQTDRVTSVRAAPDEDGGGGGPEGHDAEGGRTRATLGVEWLEAELEETLSLSSGSCQGYDA